LPFEGDIVNLDFFGLLNYLASNSVLKIFLVVLWFKLESKHEAASAYVDAAHCYKKINMNGMYIIM
jgi:hypothetical protein